MREKKVFLQFISFLNTGFLVLLLGCKTPLPYKQFTNIDPLSIGIEFRNDIRETQFNNILTNEYTYNGGGVATGDINNDGFADVYFSGNSVSNRLYINKGEWQFEDVTTTSGTAGRKDWTTGVSMVDINGDGWLDIYVCYSGNTPEEGYNKPVIRNQSNRSNQLFINNGCKPGGVPTFKDKAKEFGIDAIGTFSTQAYFFDYDVDGDLDMFLLNHANTFYAPFINTKKLRNLRHPYFGNKLYRNDNMRFVEVSKEAGIHGSGINFGLSAMISDLNMDNWPDLYVTNDYAEQDYCYINNRDGTFREVSFDILSHMSKSSMGSDIADINNDGYADILVLDMLPEDNHRQKLLRGQANYILYQLAVDSSYHHQYMRNTLQLNRGLASDTLPRYSEIGQYAGISYTDWSWSPLIVDFDNDGLKDIFISNGYLRDITNMDYIKHIADVYRIARARRRNIDYLKLIQELPTTKLKNYIYKNLNGIKFTNKTDDWGFIRKTCSNGAAYVDFDNDGDYDLITNNLNQTVSILKNNQNDNQNYNFIKLKLIGKDLNTMGIGAKIWLETEDKNIFREAFNIRGYLSSSDPLITIGIGNSTQIISLKVLWPDGNELILKDIAPNQLLELTYTKSQSNSNIHVYPNKTLLVDVTEFSGIKFRHIESKYVDFNRDKLLLYQLSKIGGKLATGDVNNDGNDDIYFGGAAGQSGELYFGTDNGRFYASKGQPWTKDREMEDMKPAFFDADGDGDLDLYVVSGGSMFDRGSPMYQDRLYINNGSGFYKDQTTALPREFTSGSCAVSGDFDKDGDLDLFIGGRHQVSKYPYPPESFILRNESKGEHIKFVNATSEVSTSLQNIGMVTEALWTDYDSDTWPDLIVVGEWMGIKIFKNENGRLIEQKFPSLENSNGWWTAIQQMDVDSDGDIDYLLGNNGLNSQIKTSIAEPVEMYANDFNNDGRIDPILCYYIQGKSYPMHSRDELLEQLISLRRKFNNYASYSDATIEDVFAKKLLDKTFKLKAYIMESCWLENINGDFRLHKLPDLVQFSPVNSFISDDFNGDGIKDIIAAGNFFPFKPQIGMNDASFGALLQFSDSTLALTHDVISPLWLYGDIRDMALLSFNNGVKRVVVSRNNNAASIYEVVH